MKVDNTKRQLPSCKLMVGGCKPVASVLHFGTCKFLVSKEFAESVQVNVEEGDNCSLLAANGGLMEFAGTVTLTVGVGNDSVVHKFVLVKKSLYTVLLESDFLSQMDTQ